MNFIFYSLLQSFSISPSLSLYRNLPLRLCTVFVYLVCTPRRTTVVYAYKENTFILQCCKSIVRKVWTNLFLWIYITFECLFKLGYYTIRNKYTCIQVYICIRIMFMCVDTVCLQSRCWSGCRFYFWFELFTFFLAWLEQVANCVGLLKIFNRSMFWWVLLQRIFINILCIYFRFIFCQRITKF